MQNWQSYSLDNNGLLIGKTFQKNATSNRYATSKRRSVLAKGLPLSLSGTSSANSSTSSSGEMILIAYYGYDPSNRRAYRLLYGTTTWWSYGGWRVAEEMDGGTQGFPAQRVHWDGVGIDEHLAT